MTANLISDEGIRRIRQMRRELDSLVGAATARVSDLQPRGVEFLAVVYAGSQGTLEVTTEHPATFTDERYYAFKCELSPLTGSSHIWPRFPRHEHASEGYFPMVAHNLAEMELLSAINDIDTPPTPSVPKHGAHLVQDGSVVVVRGWPDRAGVMRYFFREPVPFVTVKVLTVSAEADPIAWPRSYTAQPIAAGTAYGTSRDMLNQAESRYASEWYGGYAPLAVNDVVLAWWDFDNQRFVTDTYGDMANVSECETT